MSKICPNCQKSVSEGESECPYCGIIFSKWRPRQKAPEPKQEPEPPPRVTIEPKKKRSAIPIVLIGTALVILSVGGFFFFRSGGMRGVKSIAQKVQGKEWKYPPGNAEETARAMSVEQLIGAWGTVPDRTQTALHATYAKALGLKGKDAAGATGVLAPYVTDKDLHLRQGAMEGLAGIGEVGLPHLVRALKYWDTSDPNNVTIRWDAAMAIAKMGPKAKNAENDLLAAIMNPQENVNVKGDAAVALAGIGIDAVPSLNKARCYFYDKQGTSPAETSVLRTINLSLQRMNAPMESCKGLEPKQADSVSGSAFLSTSQISQMQVPELIEALKKDHFHTGEIADELARKGARPQAIQVLDSLLRDRTRITASGIRMALRKLGAPVTYAWEKNSFLPIKEDTIGHIEWSAEAKGDAVYSSGKIYVGHDVIAGLSRTQKGLVTLPAFVKYTLRVKGGSLSQPIEKTFDANTAGEHSWDNVMLASGIGPGKYSVSLFLHAQFVKDDGTGQILNNNAGFIEVER